MPFVTVRPGGEPAPHPDGSVTGWSGRVWHRSEADLSAWSGAGPVRLRWRYTADARHTGRGVYVDGLRVLDGGRTLFDEARPSDAALIGADGWVASTD
ncbi:hypothetical protein ACE14D_24855 [Streptomyces sp. Act-28]